MQIQWIRNVGSLALGGMLFIAAGAAGAQDVTAAEPSGFTNLTLESAVDLALRDNPQLKSLRAKWESMSERPARQDALPNPMLSFSGMDTASGGEWPDTNEKRVMLEQSLPGYGKRGLKEKIALQDAEVMQRDFEAMARDVVMMVKESFFDFQAVQRASAITRDDEHVLKRIETIAETLYSAGERTQQDVIKAQTEITMLKQKLIELQVQENTLKARLNVLLNRRPEAPLGLAGTEPPKPDSLDAQRLFDLAEKSRPEIQGAQALIRRSEHERDLMKKEFWPDYRVGAEYRDPGDGDDMLMVTVGIDLPVWRSKNRAGVREARKMIESAEAALAAARQQAAFEVQDARYKLLSAGRTLDLYTTELIPQAQARFSSSESGYRSGKVDFMDLLESQRFLLNARIMAVMAEGSVGMQASRLERALGTSMDEPKGLK